MTIDMPTPQNPVICLGCSFWDTIFKIDRIPEHGKVLPEKAVQAASGMATAAAVAIARLGGHVELWARIGDDPTGDPDRPGVLATTQRIFGAALLQRFRDDLRMRARRKR